MQKNFSVLFQQSNKFLDYLFQKNVVVLLWQGLQRIRTEKYASNALASN